MKRLLLALLLLATSALADTTVAPMPVGTWTLMLGTANVQTGIATMDACRTAAAADAEERKAGATYRCRTDLSFAVTYAAPAPTPAPVPTTVFTRIAGEGGAFTVTDGSVVRFGADTRWVQKTISGTSACTNAVFGDPALGTLKECDIVSGSVAAPTPTPTPAPAPSPTSAPPATAGAVTASLLAARTTGTAPLAVHFDATGTTSATAGTDTFRSLKYSFDFGDEHGQKWAVSGLPKNTQTGGPLAAHVFDVAGSYTVSVRATDAAGNASTASVQIIVADPSAVYAGAKTVCVSLTADFTGCPAGAVQQKTIPKRGGWNGKRWLLHAGQDFTALGKLDIQDGDVCVQVASFGAGAKPIVQSVGVGDWRPNTTNFATDVSIIGLATKGGMAQNVGKRVLFYGNDLTGNGFAFGDTGGWGLFDDTWRFTPKSAYSNPSELFFVENTVVGSTSIGYNAFGWGARMGWMGNDFGTVQYHNLRVTQSFKSFFGHNRLRGNLSTSTYHVFKLHAGGQSNGTTGAYDDNMLKSGGGWISRFNVIANNEFSSATDNAGWKTAFCPENDQYLEPIEDLIAENNRYVVSKANGTDLLFGGKRMTARGNVRSDGTPAQTGTCHEASLPADRKGPYYFEK